MPVQEMQFDNIERHTDWIKDQAERKQLVDEQGYVHPNIEQDLNNVTIISEATADAMALHELLISRERRQSMDIAMNIRKPTSNVSQGRRSSIGRRSSVDVDKTRRASIDQETRILETSIGAILCSRTRSERQEIMATYTNLYGDDLAFELKYKLTGEFGQLIQALLDTPTRYDAKQLHQAVHTTSMITGLSTKDSTLIEILCTRTNQEIRAIKREYRQIFGQYLEHDVSKATWHHLMHLLMWLTAVVRDESNTTECEKAHEDAMSLYGADEAHFARNSALFSVILSTQNYAQLRAIFVQYRDIAGVDIEKVIEREFTGDFRDALMTIVAVVNNTLPTLFAQRIHRAIHSMGTHDTSLIRMIVTRSEIDMSQIKREYERFYQKTLENEIRGYCSGCYRDGLLELIRRAQ